MSFSTFLTKQMHAKNIIIRKMSFRAASSIFFGKSGLTPTGKASIFIAACSGVALGINSHLDRQHKERLQIENQQHQIRLQTESHQFQEAENQKNRSAAAVENEKQRQHERARWAHEEKMASSKQQSPQNSKTSWFRK